MKKLHKVCITIHILGCTNINHTWIDIYELSGCDMAIIKSEDSRLL